MRNLLDECGHDASRLNPVNLKNEVFSRKDAQIAGLILAATAATRCSGGMEGAFHFFEVVCLLMKVGAAGFFVNGKVRLRKRRKVLPSVVIRATEVVAALGADQLAAVAGEAAAAGGANLAVMVNGQVVHGASRTTL